MFGLEDRGVEGAEAQTPAFEDDDVGLGGATRPSGAGCAVALSLEGAFVEERDVDGLGSVLGPGAQCAQCVVGEVLVVCAWLATGAVQFVARVQVSVGDEIVVCVVEVVQRDGDGMQVVLGSEELDDFGSPC